MIKEDDTFLIFTSFRDACLMCMLNLYNLHLYELVKIEIRLLSLDYWFEGKNYSSYITTVCHHKK